MRFRYLGDKEDMTAFGYDFSNGAFPDVTEPHVIAKLSGNRFFESVQESTRTYEGGQSHWPKVQIFDGGPLDTPPAKKKPGRKPKQPTEA